MIGKLSDVPDIVRQAVDDPPQSFPVIKRQACARCPLQARISRKLNRDAGIAGRWAAIVTQRKPNLKGPSMKTLLKSAMLLAAILFLVSASPAQNKRGPSTPEERSTAVKAARLLESDPFHKDAKKAREWFTFWLIEVPDISLELCTDYLGPIAGAKKNYSSEIFGQTMFSSAAFIIEHPEQAQDKVAVNLAGVEGALKVYEAVLKTKPKARWEFLDELVAKREKGELGAYVQEIAQTKCKGKQ
jgi:hypothetical protein